MLTKPVVDTPRYQAGRRLILAQKELCDRLKVEELPQDLTIDSVPKPLKQLFRHYLKVKEQAQAVGIGVSTNIPMSATEAVRHLRRNLVQDEQLPEDQVEFVIEEEFKGFLIKVFKRLDKEGTEHVYQAVILKDGDVVRQLHYRAKRPYVVIEHYAKRAIKFFISQGEWPQKIGIPITRN